MESRRNCARFPLDYPPAEGRIGLWVGADEALCEMVRTPAPRRYVIASTLLSSLAT
jgi:hypothetical protein